MGRPRRQFGGQEDIEPLPEPFLAGEQAFTLGVREQRRWEASTHWHYRAANGVYDPLTYLHVLDAVAGINPDIELRSKALTEWLEENQKAFHWDPITVGKVLSDLEEAFEDKLGEKRGLLEKGKDYKGHFYSIHHTPDVARLYKALRTDLMRLTELEMNSRSLNRKTQRLESPLLECPSVRQEWDAVAQ
jgi:hypothetical protein